MTSVFLLNKEINTYMSKESSYVRVMRMIAEINNEPRLKGSLFTCFRCKKIYIHREPGQNCSRVFMTVSNIICPLCTLTIDENESYSEVYCTDEVEYDVADEEYDDIV